MLVCPPIWSGLHPGDSHSYSAENHVNWKYIVGEYHMEQNLSPPYIPRAPCTFPEQGKNVKFLFQL